MKEQKRIRQLGISRSKIVVDNKTVSEPKTLVHCNNKVEGQKERSEKNRKSLKKLPEPFRKFHLNYIRQKIDPRLVSSGFHIFLRTHLL